MLAYVAFVSLGLPDAVLGVAWPSIARAHDVPPAALGAPLAVGAASYFASGISAGRLVERLGVGGLLCASTLLTTLGVVGYALAPAFSLFLLAAIAVGFGSGAIDTSLNTYAARHFGAQHMTWLHAAYSAGAASSPALMTTVLARGQVYSRGYALIACALAVVGTAFLFTRRAWGERRDAAGVPERSGADTRAGRDNAWTALRSRPAQLNIATFFVYGGIEIGVGQWSYTLLTRARGMDALHAGEWVTTYWASLFVGRVVLGFVVRRVGTVRLMRLATFGAALGAWLFALATHDTVAGVGLGLLGFSLAPIFPGLMSETPRRVGDELAAHAVGFQVSAATLGVAMIPNLAGLISERLGLWAIAPFFAVGALLLLTLHELLVRRA